MIFYKELIMNDMFSSPVLIQIKKGWIRWIDLECKSSTWEKSKYYLEKSSKYMKEEREYERLRQKYINHKILAKYYHSIIVNSPS